MKSLLNKSINKNWLLLLLVLFALNSCSQHNPTSQTKSVKPIYWPTTTRPVIEYLGSFSNANDLEISRSFWTQFIEFFAGEKDTHLVKPMAIITDQQGVIYVADPGARGVHRFDQANQSYTLILRKDDRPLPSPVGLLLDNQSNLIISDSKLGALYKVVKGETVANKFITDTTFKQPTGMVADDNNFYVVDTPEHKILKLNFNGQLISEFGHRGSTDGEFNYPTMIGLNNEQLLVSDTLNFRIQKLDKHGKFISTFGQLGNATGHHSRSKGIASDKNQNIYVVDGLFHTVQVFNNSGDFLMNFGEQGQAVGQFWLPTGIFIDQQQIIYVADTYNRRVQMFRYLGAQQ